MSTEIYDDGRLHVTRFYGGYERGMCYEIVDRDGIGVVPMTRAELIRLAVALGAELGIPCGYHGAASGVHDYCTYENRTER